MVDDLANRSAGQRIKYFRERAGMSRPVLGGLVGKSAEWVKAVETDRLLTPRLPMLLRLAEVLGVADLATLTGQPRLSTATYARSAHEQLPGVVRSLVSYPMTGAEVSPDQLADIEQRVSQVWQLWHTTKRQRTAIAGLLPGLLTDTRLAARRMEGPLRRRAQRALAQTYHLTQLYLSFQPVPELVSMTGDRAMTAAQDADDPRAMATAAWYMNHVYRDAGQQHEARVELALNTAALLRPRDGDDEERSLWGLLQLAVALSHAKVGHEGDAWRYWDLASGAARSLPAGYHHPYLIFGQGMVDAYAVTINNDLMRTGEATRAADQLDLAAMPSATRRSFHLIETARAYNQRREHLATVHLLRKAYDESPDTARFNLFTRSTLVDLTERGGATIRDEVRELATRLELVS
jgi:transcriptional regulator with XRE-family HTH domain